MEREEGRKRERAQEPQRVGEGTYGCVFAPSIKCRESVQVDYSSRVSKLMRSKNASDEVRSFVKIGKIDPEHEYHTGAPIKCTPRHVSEAALRECKHGKFSSRDMEMHPKKYSLLLMKNGGRDLKAMVREFAHRFPSARVTGRFWEQTLHLMRGLHRFREGGFVHYDIKAHNILFDSATGAMRFIDFGLSGMRATIERKCREGKFELARIHFNYPIECAFLERDSYMRFAEMDDEEQEMYMDSLQDILLNGLSVAGNPFHIRHLDSRIHEIMASLFAMIDPTDTDEFAYRFVRESLDGIRAATRAWSYEQYVRTVLDSVDIYGFGITMQYCLLGFLKHLPYGHPLTDHADAVEQMHEFFYSTYAPNIMLRVTNIDTLLSTYEPILRQFVAVLPSSAPSVTQPSWSHSMPDSSDDVTSSGTDATTAAATSSLPRSRNVTRRLTSGRPTKYNPNI